MTDLARLCAERMGWELFTLQEWERSGWKKNWKFTLEDTRGPIYPALIQYEGQRLWWQPLRWPGQHWDPEHNIQDAWVLVEYATEHKKLSLELTQELETWFAAFLPNANTPDDDPRWKHCHGWYALEDIAPLAITKAFVEATE